MKNILVKIIRWFAAALYKYKAKKIDAAMRKQIADFDAEVKAEAEKFESRTGQKPERQVLRRNWFYRKKMYHRKTGKAVYVKQWFYILDTR